MESDTKEKELRAIKSLIQNLPIATIRLILKAYYQDPDQLLSRMQRLYQQQYPSTDDDKRKHKKSRTKKLLAQYYRYDAPIKRRTIKRKIKGFKDTLPFIGSTQERLNDENKIRSLLEKRILEMLKQLNIVHGNFKYYKNEYTISLAGKEKKIQKMYIWDNTNDIKYVSHYSHPEQNSKQKYPPLRILKRIYNILKKNKHFQDRKHLQDEMGRQIDIDLTQQ